MGKNPVVAVIAVIVLIVAVVIIFRQLGVGAGGIGGPKDAYWYDLDTGKLFPHKAVTPPVKAPSGGEGVRAYVYACTSCDDKSDRFIGFLERYSDEGKKILEEGPTADSGPMYRVEAMEHSEVRREADAEWVSGANMEEAMALRQEHQTKCGGKPAKPCFVFQD